MELTDVMIHLDDSIEPAGRTTLETTLSELQGVVSPRFGVKEHLLFVVYDSDDTSAITILEHIREQGFGAQIAGI